MLYCELDFVAVNKLNVSLDNQPTPIYSKNIHKKINLSALDLSNVKFEAKSLACFFMKSQCYMKLDVFDPTVFVS